MLKTDLQRIVAAVCRRARRQGFVCPQEVKNELAGAGLPEARWQEVVSLAGDMLSDRDGCYYYSSVAAAARRAERRQRRLARAVRQLMRGYKALVPDERRGQGRMEFMQPIPVETEDGHCHTVLSCDLSESGIRLIAPLSLLGKRIRLTLPSAAGARHRSFFVRILWSSVVGDGLFENGGVFLGIAKECNSRILQTAAAAVYPPAGAQALPRKSVPPILIGGPLQPRAR
jgi:hypothetical protein